MESLLPHYERELATLRQSSAHFAQRYPKIAGRLQLAGDGSEDPHVERMIESFALLAARVHKRLDDDFPLFTESLLEVLYPHYLRPFPSCSIARFELGQAAAQMARPQVIERGAVLTSRPVKGVTCRFRTTQAVVLRPVTVSDAAFRHVIAAPEGTRLPSSATSVLSITLSLQSGQATWSGMFEAPLRIYLDGEASQITALREALCRRVVGMLLQRGDQPVWHATHQDGQRFAGLSLTGFAEDEALLEADARSHAAYRLLTEYFAFPEKFNFVDLALPAPLLAALERRGGLEGGAHSPTLTVHLLMAGVRSDSDEGRLLETIEARHFVTGCTPVINLFSQPADPIRVTHQQVSYPVLADSRRAWAYEVSSVDRVYRVIQTPNGESIDEFRPFFSLRHDALLQAGGDADRGRYWHAQRLDGVAEQSPGYETEITLVDGEFDPSRRQTETLSLQVTATNRDLPTLLPFGTPGGDLFLEGGGLAREVRLLRKPTPTWRFPRGQGALWRLISHLSLNHLSLSAGGMEALQEMLRLYDLPRSAANRRQVDGLKSVSFRPATAWLPGQPFATFVRGTEVRLEVDEDSYVGTGLFLLASVLERFFALYVHINSFTKLTLVSSRTGEEVLTCLPRNGDQHLL